MDEILISPAEAKAIERLLTKLRTSTERDDDSGCSQDNRGPHKSEMVDRATAILRERKRRGKYFNRSMFAEPAWDMLLAIYVMQGHRISVAKLVAKVDVPQTTALRWLQYLEKERFVGKAPDPDDRRQVSVHLLENGLQQLEAYLRSIPGALPLSSG